jgi:ribosomal protein S18 acetylase RimI-like enzyme
MMDALTFEDSAGPGLRPGRPLFKAGRECGLHLRPESETDIPFLRQLYISLRWEEFSHLEDWTNAQKIEFLEQQFTAQRTHYLRFYFDSEFLILEKNGLPVGRLYLHRGPSEIRVVDIGFLPEMRNRGYGTALLSALFREGQASGRTVSVHVEVFNPAQRLYRRLGFVIAGEDGPYRLMVWKPAGSDSD